MQQFSIVKQKSVEKEVNTFGEFKNIHLSPLHIKTGLMKIFMKDKNKMVMNSNIPEEGFPKLNKPNWIETESKGNDKMSREKFPGSFTGNPILDSW